MLALTPLTCDLMGWRGALQANGSASIGAYFFFGGLTMMLGGVGEVIHKRNLSTRVTPINLLAVHRR